MDSVTVQYPTSHDDFDKKSAPDKKQQDRFAIQNPQKESSINLCQGSLEYSAEDDCLPFSLSVSVVGLPAMLAQEVRVFLHTLPIAAPG